MSGSLSLCGLQYISFFISIFTYKVLVNTIKVELKTKYLSTNFISSFVDYNIIVKVQNSIKETFTQDHFVTFFTHFYGISILTHKNRCEHTKTAENTQK